MTLTMSKLRAAGAIPSDRRCFVEINRAQLERVRLLLADAARNWRQTDAYAGAPLGSFRKRSLPNAATAAEAVGVEHPIGQRSTVAMAAASFGSCPRRDGAEQERSCQRKGEDDGTGARMRDRCFRICNDGVDAVLGITAREPRRCCDQPNQVGAVVAGDAAVA